MRDHLDDPTPPPGDRAAVVARAHRLLLRRRGVLAGAGTTTVVALVVALAVAVQGGSSAPSRLAATDPTTTSAQTPSEGASPSVPATPGPTASAPAITHVPSAVVALPPPAASPTTSPTPTCYSNPSDDCPDGQPGYGDAHSFQSCRNATTVPDGDGSADLGAGVVASLAVPASVKGGSHSSASLVITNQGTEAAQVTVMPDHGYHDQGIETPSSWDALVVGGAVHGYSQQEFGPEPETFTLEPSGARSFEVTLTTSGCGDTQSDQDVPLPAGDHRFGFELQYGTGTTADQTTALGGTLHIT